MLYIEEWLTLFLAGGVCLRLCLRWFRLQPRRCWGERDPGGVPTNEAETTGARSKSKSKVGVPGLRRSGIRRVWDQPGEWVRLQWDWRDWANRGPRWICHGRLWSIRGRVCLPWRRSADMRRCLSWAVRGKRLRSLCALLWEEVSMTWWHVATHCDWEIWAIKEKQACGEWFSIFSGRHPWLQNLCLLTISSGWGWFIDQTSALSECGTMHIAQIYELTNLPTKICTHTYSSRALKNK